ncbi:hypothetical protein [Edaphobacter aggregans]|uniref:hypothetical protein n=1 Tax=Edaphobacter aggregans TaxID=570835 RepID=UPI0005521B1C|nr:hypothetical protein [Edaphobacter aggregans]
MRIESMTLPAFDWYAALIAGSVAGELPGRLSGIMAAGLMVSMGWAQQAGAGPEVSILVPSGASVEGIQIAFFMGGPFGGHGVVAPEPKMQRFVFDASVNGVAANRVQAVVYMPGCELSRYDIAMGGESVERQAECKVLPAWPLGGQLVMDARTVAALGKHHSPLEIEVGYMAFWVSDFFGIMDGLVTTFHVATVPLGKDGSFSVMLPELVQDPAEKSAKERYRGAFLFRLREKKTWNIVGTLRPTEFAISPFDGLELRTQYPALRFELKP